jgi:hypothetical protein
MSQAKAKIRTRRDDRGQLASELQRLRQKSTQELHDDWQRLVGTPPPSKLSRDLLMRVIADKLQEAALGGLPSSAKRRLAALMLNGEKGREASLGTPMLRLKPGSKLVRAWRGTTHTVLVLADGFEHQGRRYTSLTQIAQELTGAHWSGPRFFGLVTSQRDTAGSRSNDGSP